MTTELDALANEAASIDAEAAPASFEPVAEVAAEPAPMPVDPAESLAGFLAVVGIAAGYAGFPKTASIWNPQTCKGLADKAVPVLVKYPWGARLLDFLQTGAGVEELALLAYAAPLVLATRAAVLEDMKPAAPTAPAPGSPEWETRN